MAAAREWHESAFRMQRIVTGHQTEVTWAEAVRMASRARRGFYSVARQDIGIGTGEVSEVYEWQLPRLLPDDEPTR